MCVDSYLCLAWTSVVGKETACLWDSAYTVNFPPTPGCLPV